MMGFMGLHFGVPSSAIAYLPAAYGLTYGVVALVSGPLSDRWGRKRPLQAGLLGFALFNAAIAQATSLWMAVVLSALAGLCAAVVQPNALSLAADESAPDRAGRSLGHVLAGLMLAFVVTPVLAGRVADTLGWASAYYALSAMGLGACFWVTKSFVNRLPVHHEPTHFLETHRRALLTPGVRLRLVVSYLWLGWVAGFGAIVAEIAARKLSLSPSTAGLLAGYYGVAVIVGNLSGSRWQQCWGDKALPLAATMSALGLLAFVLPVPSVWVLALLGTPWAFGYGCAGPLHHAKLSSLSPRYRGTVNSYHASLLNLGIFSVSFVFGTMTPVTSLTAFYCVAAAFALAGAGLLVAMARPTRGWRLRRRPS